MIQTKTIIFIILIILLAVGVAAANQYIGKKSIDGQPVNPDDPTADWAVYRNDKFGYEMRYPSNLIVSHPYGEQNPRFMKEGQIHYAVSVTEMWGSVMYQGEERLISSLSLKDQLLLSFKQRCKTSNLNTISWKVIEIDGIGGIQASYSHDECINKYLPTGCIRRNDRLFCVVVGVNAGSSEIYTHIISTIKFYK